MGGKSLIDVDAFFEVMFTERIEANIKNKIDGISRNNERAIVIEADGIFWTALKHSFDAIIEETDAINDGKQNRL